MAGALPVGHHPLADRDRDPSGRENRPALLHRSRHGRGDRRNRRDRRRLHALSGRHPGRYQLEQGQAPPDARRQRGDRRRRQGAGAVHGRRQRPHRFEFGGGQGSAGQRHGGRRAGPGGRSRRRRRSVRREIARKLGFDAYGATPDMPDPEAHAINQMLDHIHALDRTVRQLCQALRDAGIEPGELRLPDLNGCELHSAACPEDWSEQRDASQNTANVERKTRKASV
ncbi:MAG: hypothetical protein MZU84_05405 [Sphingobacterium sp.]|nr:hypothetical protein [Sphingobacterium sp.]